MPEARLDRCLQWSHLSSGHTGANRSVDFFCECFYSSLTMTELRSRMQTIVDACGCHASKQSDSGNRVLISRVTPPELLYIWLLSFDELRLAMNAHLPVVRPLLCSAHPGATPMHQTKIGA